MAFTRKFLKELGIDSELIDKIIDEHRGTVDGLKDEIDNLKADADANNDIKKELERLKADAQKDDTYKTKYDEIKKEFDDFKTSIDNEKTITRKTEAYRKALKDAGISEKRIESVLRLAKADGLVDAIEFDGDNVKDIDKITDAIKGDYAEYIESVKEVGANVPNPPTTTNTNTFDTMSLAEKMEYANANPNDAGVVSWLKS